MPIKKRSINSQNGYTDYRHLKSDFNSASFNNPVHGGNEPTNFILKSITLEDCDRSVFEEFNERFKIGEVDMPVMLLDAELLSLMQQNLQQYDSDKTYLNFPMFTLFRKKSTPKYRTNAAYKKTMYTVPKQTANGLIYEDYISEAPLSYDLIYDVKFITNRRDFTNEMEIHMRHYFRNKRNIIIINGFRFSIGPEDFANMSEVEIVNRENLEQKTIYVTTYSLKLECFVFNKDNVQKRERTNRILLDINVKGVKKSDPIVFERYDLQLKKYPQHPYPFSKGKSFELGASNGFSEGKNQDDPPEIKPFITE